MDCTAAHCDGYSPRCSCTNRTARSRTSGENLLFLLMAPFSQELKPPQNPVRFISMSTLPDVVLNFARVDTATCAAASAFQAAMLADVAGRRGTKHGRIAPVDMHMALCGPAFTVEVRPGDNLMIHAAIALAQPGDILVIDGKGDLTAALMGTLMLSVCKKRNLGGVVVDGAIRDRLEVLELGFPVFSAGFNPAGPTKLVSGRINHPISAGGATVMP